MFVINVTISNPMARESRTIDRQFDPATMTQAKWTAAWPTIKAEIDALMGTAQTAEPTPW